MKLRGVEFGHVLGASGVQGFFGEGYPYHRYAQLVGLDFSGMTFVSKTTTLRPRSGNMPVAEDGITPTQFKPDCIRVRFAKGLALNAVGLTGPGAESLLATGRWQEREQPFLLSFMSVDATMTGRLDDFRNWCVLLLAHKDRFRAPFGLQVNASCPNVGLDPNKLLTEIEQYCLMASVLDIPIMIKLNALVDPQRMHDISQIEGLDAVCCSNTLPWGTLPDRINWDALFGTRTSPLAHLGGGGLSGAPLLPIVEDWVKSVRDAGITIPINAGGGILSVSDAERLIVAGADSVFIGSMAFLRPWRVQHTISHINQLMNKETSHE